MSWRPFVKFNFPLSDFEYHMSCMRTYIKEDFNEKGYVTSDQVKKSYDGIVKYAYIRTSLLDNDNQDCLVTCCFTGTELRDFDECAKICLTDDEKVDWFEFFKQKHDNYFAKQRAEFKQKYGAGLVKKQL